MYIKQLSETLTQTSSKSVFLYVFNLPVEGALIFGDGIGNILFYTRPLPDLYAVVVKHQRMYIST